MWLFTSRWEAIPMATCIRLIVLLVLQSNHASAQASDATWLYPPKDGLTFYYQDTVNISYESAVALPYLAIYCRQGVGECTSWLLRDYSIRESVSAT